MSENEAQDDALDSILPAAAPSHAPATPPLELFQPWHLPRKQYVRKQQWADSLEKLLDLLPDRRLINYLGLPGEDMLDVQALADVCRVKQRKLRYLGFDQSLGSGRPSIQRIAAEQIVRQTDVVEETSLVLPDDFTSIAHPKSIGYRRLRDFGSYDVVNLDMCDAFTTHDWAPTHQAILALLNHQTHHRGEPWLLFLTTRSEVARLQRPELDAYAKAIQQNAIRSADFCRCLANVATVAMEQDVPAMVARIEQLLERDTYLSGRWLTIGIGKWLLGIMGGSSPWRVDLLSVFSYRTGLLSAEGLTFAGEPPNLFSLVFRFEKIRQQRKDPAGLGCKIPDDTEIPNEHVVSEVKLAVKLAKCVEQHTRDVDLCLQADAGMHEALSKESEALLAVRYYSPEAYRLWVQKLPRINA